MAYTRFDTTKINGALLLYKSNNSEISLLYDLYDLIDHIIIRVSNNMCKTFSKKYPDDFFDIQQDIKLQVFKILPKLAVLSVDGEQLTRILVSAIGFAFRTAYKKYKKNTPVKANAESGLFSYSDWHPDEKVLIEFSFDELDRVISSVDHTFNPINYDITQGRLVVFKIESMVDTSIYINQIFNKILNEVMSMNRYKKAAPVIKFCLISLINGRQPSVVLINNCTKSNSANFYINYTKVLLRMSILKVYQTKGK